MRLTQTASELSLYRVAAQQRLSPELVLAVQRYMGAVHEQLGEIMGREADRIARMEGSLSET